MKWKNPLFGNQNFPAASSRIAARRITHSLGGNFKVCANKGSFSLDPAFGYGGIHGLRSDGQEINFPQIDQFAAEMDDFARCILENRPTKVPGEEGLRDVKIMMAIYEAAKTARS